MGKLYLWKVQPYQEGVLATAVRVSYWNNQIEVMHGVGEVFNYEEEKEMTHDNRATEYELQNALGLAVG
tara:strand:+ start:495 stop:701 length:207 start_codon:yes stop_codon:yes gene_type:complete